MLSKKLTLALFHFILILFCFKTNLRAQDLTKYVDPMTGTGGVGHTYPGATMPFGMVQLSPDTRRDPSWEGCAGYYHADTLIYGFTHTHLSGTGCSDYGDVLLMPGVGKGSFKPEVYGSGYRHSDENASPGYYAVQLTDDDIRAEFTVTTRVGLHRYSFGKDGRRYLILDLRHRDNLLGHELKVVSPTRVEGYRRSEAWAKDQTIYFSMEFSEPVAEFEYEGPVNMKEFPSPDSKAVIMYFDRNQQGSNKTPKPLLVKVGISTVDAAGARRNLEAELSGWDFEQTRSTASAAWNAELGKIVVSGKSRKDFFNFYTALYHTMVVPNVISDIDGRYRGRDNKIHTTDGYTQYTVFSLWDTFRATHPLYTLIDRKRTLDYIKTFLAQYQQGGRLPVWELGASETDCMIGYHSVPVITDALAKGIGGFDTSLAFEAMKKSATWNHLGIPAYIQRGYMGVEDEHESVSKTLEYAYDDWCISEVARMLGQEQDRQNFLVRAMSYQNVFDPQTGFMRPRRNGAFLPKFDPREVNNHYTEANSWQYSFFVPQDIPGLVKLMGGTSTADRKLDGLFTEDSRTTGRTQADITGLIGQYAHGNEPSHHMAYLYNYIGKPWKTQKIVRQIMDSLYQKGPEGLPGNEDCGQMSAWFVWSAMGFYPVTPGSPYYAIGSPLFDSIMVRLENGHKVNIIVKRKSPSDVYVSKFSIDGIEIKENLITHQELTTADRVLFEMTDKPNLTRGTDIERRGEIVDTRFVLAPCIMGAERLFSDSLLIEMQGPGQIRYSDNGDSIHLDKIYQKPFYISNTKVFHARSYSQNLSSGLTSAQFFRVPSKWNVVFKTTPGKQYQAEGPVSMVDGIRGSENWRKGDWFGFQGSDMEVEIELDELKDISSVHGGFLQDTRPWIFMPKEMIVEYSADGKIWKTAGRVRNAIADNDQDVSIQDLEVDFGPVKARFVRVKATNYGKLPAWHPGAGYDAYIFCDEIIIQ